MDRLIVKRFVNYASAWTTSDCETDHASYMVQMTLNETLCAVQRVNPDYHVFLVELVRKFKKVPGGFTCFLMMHLLDLVKILAITVLVHLVVHEKHLLRNELLIDLVWPYVWLTSVELPNLILLTDYLCPWKQLL